MTYTYEYEACNEKSTAAFHVLPADSVSENYRDEKYAKYTHDNGTCFTKLHTCHAFARQRIGEIF